MQTNSSYIGVTPSFWDPSFTPAKYLPKSTAAERATHISNLNYILTVGRKSWKDIILWIFIRGYQCKDRDFRYTPEILSSTNLNRRIYRRGTFQTFQIFTQPIKMLNKQSDCNVKNCTLIFHFDMLFFNHRYCFYLRKIYRRYLLFFFLIAETNVCETIPKHE